MTDRSTGPRRAWTVAAVVVAVLGGCSGEGSSRPAAPVARAAEQHLRVAVGEDEFMRGEPPARDVGMLADGLNPGIFETLTMLTPSFGVRAGLAQRWEAHSPTEWRFELRDGVRFHDGTPLDAAAVVESLRRITGPGVGNVDADTVALRRSPPRGLEPDSASVVDDLVVGITLSEPNLRLAEQLADPSTAIQAPGTHAGDGSTSEATPTGTGPFRFSSYRPGVDLEVIADPAYRDGAPELDSITFRFGEARDASLLLATGEVDAVGYVAAELLANVSGGPERLMRSVPARSALVLLNRGGIGEWATLQEDAVREAVVLAVDRGAVAATAWPAHGEPSRSLIPEVVLGAAAEEVRPPPSDVAAAGEVLDEAGWTVGSDGIRERDGRRLVLDVTVRHPGEGLPAAAAAVADQLASVGIATTVTSPSAGGPTPLQRVNAASFDLFVDLRPQVDADPCALCRLFSIRPGGDLTVSGVVGAGEAADTLFEQVHIAPSIDAARRGAADLVQVVVRDEMVAVPLATLSNVWLVSSRVEAFEPAAVSGAQEWRRVFLSR